MPNILIVEDDININNLLCEVLRKAGYTCEQAFSGTEAKLLLDIKEKAYTLVLLDLMLPGASGEEVLKEIRKQGRLPVIVLTAKDSIDDKIGVLTDGADDYITKPFNPLELIARVNSQIRRYTHLGSIADKQQEGNTYWSGELVINDDTKQVTVEGKDVKLTPTEYNILKFLTKNKGIVYSIEQIYQNVWEDECYGAENIIAVHIRHIREKIEINPREPKYLKVIWGIGYKIENLEK